MKLELHCPRCTGTGIDIRAHVALGPIWNPHPPGELRVEAFRVASLPWSVACPTCEGSGDHPSTRR